MLKNLNEYNVKYMENGELKFDRIGEPIDKKGIHPRKRKVYPKIDIKYIRLPENPEINFDYLAEINDEYLTHKNLPPVWLTFDHLLIGGYEIYYYCKINRIKRIPYQQKKGPKNISLSKSSYRSFHFVGENGVDYYISRKQGKHIREMRNLCRELGYTLKIKPANKLEYTIADQNGDILIDHEQKRGIIFDFLTYTLNTKQKNNENPLNKKVLKE